MQTTGVAAGVPYVAVPPTTERPDAPVVLAWHLMDAPRTERAFAAALPLAGLDAWRIYLGLPLAGSRSPGQEEVMRLGYEDAVLNLHGPINALAAAEAPATYAALRAELAIGDGPLGLLGGSAGAAVVLELLAGGTFDAAAAVIVSPLTQLRPVVDSIAAEFGFRYPWSEAALAVAARMDYPARAADIVRHGPALRAVVGADDTTAVRGPAAALVDALGPHCDLQVVADMAHPLAEEPGDEPAPQIPAAQEVDRLAVDWFHRHL